MLTVNYDYVSLLKNLFSSDILLQPRTRDRKWQRSNNFLPNWAHYVSHWVSSISIFFSMRDNIAIIFLQSIYAHTDTQKNPIATDHLLSIVK